MKYKTILSVFVLLSAQVLHAGSMVDIVKQSGIKGGILVHLNCGDGSETADMLLNSSYLSGFRKVF